MQAGTRDVPLLQIAPTGSEDHTASHSVGTCGSFLGVNWPGREICHLLPSGTEVKNEWSYTPSPPICSHGADRNKYLLFVYSSFC